MPAPASGPQQLWPSTGNSPETIGAAGGDPRRSPAVARGRASRGIGGTAGERNRNGADAVGASRERGRRFAQLLREAAGAADGQPPPVPPFVMSETPAQAPAAMRVGGPVRAVAALEAAGRVADRVLVGTGPAGAEARIRFSCGALGGAEIALKSVPGAIEFQILGSTEPARRSLLDAVDQVATKLRTRGLVLRENASAGGRRDHRGNDRQERG